MDELLVDKRGKVKIEDRRKVLYDECMRLNSRFKTTDEEVMMRFSASLFSSPDTMLSVCQQWQSMAGHTIVPKEYQGEGRVWATLLHLLACDANLSVEMVSMFQTYETRVYLYGMESCPMMEYLHQDGFLDGTCLGEEVVPMDKRVTSPSFLRFDSGFLPTLSGRGCLCMLRLRGAFRHNQFRTGSNSCSVQANLRDELSFIYQEVFDYFRPCVVACMLVSFAWAAYRMTEPFFKQRFSRYVASLMVHIEHRILPSLEDRLLRGEESSSEDQRPKDPLAEKLSHRLSILSIVLRKFLESEECNGYTVDTLKVLYDYMWSMVDQSEESL